MPYTYLIGWSKHKKFYYGVRYSEKAHPDDLWVSYYTSSDAVKKFAELNGTPDVIQIRKQFSDVRDCVLWEKRVLTKINAKNNPLFLNQSNGYGSFQSNKGTVPVKDKITGKNLGRISTTDIRISNGEVIHTSAGVIKKPMSQLGRDHHSAKMSSLEVRKKLSKTLRVVMNTPEVRNKISLSHKIEQCVHCGAKMKRPAITNYHQDNCYIVTGRVSAPAKGRKWYNNGVNSFMKLPHEVTPEMTAGRLKGK